MKKEHRIYISVDTEELNKAKELARKLKVTKSEVIRLSIREAVAKYLEPGYRGSTMVVDVKKLDSLLLALKERILELEDPKIVAEKIGRKIHDLYVENKKKEADKLRESAIKDGIYPFYSPPTEKLSQEQKKKVLQERYLEKK